MLLAEYRRTIVELLLAERTHACAVCVARTAIANCRALAARLGVDHVRFDYLHPDRRKWTPAARRFALRTTTGASCAPRCVRVCEAVEGAHTWDVCGARESPAGWWRTWTAPGGTSTSCTDCGKCVQVCPTGALSKKGATVGEMVKEQCFPAAHPGAAPSSGVAGDAGGAHERLRDEGRRPRRGHGLAGRLLRLPHEPARPARKRLVELAGAIELVYGPLVDAKEFPLGVDVALVEGAVANVDNLGKLIQQIRARSRIVVSLGDCAVTGNVTSLRNYFTVDDSADRRLPCRSGERPPRGRGGPGTAGPAAAGAAAAPGGAGGCLPARLSAGSGTDLGGVVGPAGGEPVHVDAQSSAPSAERGESKKLMAETHHHRPGDPHRGARQNHPPPG